jgi:hypothetical protein
VSTNHSRDRGATDVAATDVAATDVAATDCRSTIFLLPRSTCYQGIHNFCVLNGHK